MAAQSPSLFARYSVIKWLVLLAAFAFAVIWFLSAVVEGFAAPHWVPPTSVLLLAVFLAVP